MSRRKELLQTIGNAHITIGKALIELAEEEDRLHEAAPSQSGPPSAKPAPPSAKRKPAGTHLLSVVTVAERLMVSRWTVYRMLNSGELNFALIHGRRKVDVRELDRYIDERKLMPEGIGQRKPWTTSPRRRK